MTRRRSKICCTLGPATSSPDAIRALVDAGMDAARLNFSHGTHADHAILYERVREASDATGRSVAVLADLQARRSVWAVSPAEPPSRAGVGLHRHHRAG